MYGNKYFASFYLADYFGEFDINSPYKYVSDGGIGIDEIAIIKHPFYSINQIPEVKAIEEIKFNTRVRYY